MPKNAKQDTLSYSIMEALFDGRIIPWERPGNMTAERLEIEEKIRQEKRYFMGNMSADDQARFERLEDLYSCAVHSEEIGIYSHGFTLGAMLMLELMQSKEAILAEG